MTDILIYGAGAIGSFLGYLLSEIPGKNAAERKRIENVALLGRAGHIKAIKEQGLHVDLGGKREVLFFRHCFSSLDELKASNYHPRLVIVCVKTHSLPDLSRELKESGLLEERFKESLFILLMNGMGNREVFLKSGLDPARLQEGITSLGVLLAGEGKVELKGRGKTVLQNQIGREDRQFLEKRFSEMGFEIEFSKDFCRQQFLKLLVNAAKHAQASHVHVTVDRIDNDIRIAVEDNGIGFDTSRLQDRSPHGTSGFGLFSIRERLTHMGGGVYIQSGHTKGTKVVLRAPLENGGSH